MPKRPSSTVAGPAAPRAASAAQTTPACAAQPAWKGFVGVPSARYSNRPPEVLPASPSAAAVVPAGRPSSEQTATVAPNTPQADVGCSPRSWKAAGAASPRRVAVSVPATIAVDNCCPLAPVCLGDRQRGRHDHRRRMHERLGVRVVVVERVAEHAVGERRLRGRGRTAPAEQLRGSAKRRPLVDAHSRASPPEPALAGGEAAAEHVQRVQLRPLDDLVGQLLEAQPRGEVGKSLGAGHASILVYPARARHRVCGWRPGRASGGERVRLRLPAALRRRQPLLRLDQRPARRRFAEHAAGRASRYTRSRLPVALVWSAACGSRSEAMREEARIKRLPRAQKLQLLGADS